MTNVETRRPLPSDVTVSPLPWTCHSKEFRNDGTSYVISTFICKKGVVISITGGCLRIFRFVVSDSSHRYLNFIPRSEYTVINVGLIDFT